MNDSLRLDLMRQATIVILGTGVGFLAIGLVTELGWMIPAGAIVAIALTVALLRYPFLGVLLWLMLAPFLMTTPTAWERAVYWLIHRALPPATVVLMILWCRRHNRLRLPALGWAELAMAGYVLVSLVSILFENSLPLATTYLFYDRVFSPMCLYLAMRLWRPGERDLQRVLPVVFFMAVSQSLIGILFWIGPRYLPLSWLTKQGRATGSLYEPSAYAVTLMFCAGILFLAASERRSLPVRLLLGIATTLAFWGVFLSLSRAAWLAGLVYLAGLACLYPRQVVRLGLSIAIPAVLVLGGFLYSKAEISASQRLHSQESERAALSRLPVYAAGIEMFAEKPLFGWGYDNFDRYAARFQVRVAGITDDNKIHASHNVYITLLAEQGLTGLVLFIWPLTWCLVKTMRAIKRGRLTLWRKQLVGVLWLSILTHVIVNNFSDLHVVFGLGLWWATLGMIASLGDSEGNAGVAAPFSDRVDV